MQAEIFLKDGSLLMETARPVDHRVFKDIRVQAFQHSFLDFRGGPVLPDPAFAQFRHKRYDRPFDAFDVDARFEKFLGGEWVYLGPKYHHFGHIMSEMVHRIVPSRMLFPGERNYLLVSTSDDPSEPGFENLCPTYRDVLEFCEIDPKRLTTLNENTIVERLCMCEQGSNLGGHPTPWYLDVLREFSTRRLDQIHGSRVSPPKVYVSKSKIPHGGVILGEGYIENLLREEDFLVFHPEDFPLSLQMDVYRKSRELVFSEGSACHGTELLGREMLDRTFVLIRRMEMRDGLGSILEPRSHECHMFLDTFILGTVAVNSATGHVHTEFSVSLADIDRLVAFFRDQHLARLDKIDVGEYFDAAETDLRSYFSYLMGCDFVDLDPWRIGEVRVAFEKLRTQFLAGRQLVPLDREAQAPSPDDAASIESQAWTAHENRRWLEAVRCWEIYRQRFPESPEGFTLGSVVLIELGRFYEADALLRLAMRKFPNSEEVLGNYALVAHHRRDWRESVTRWEQFRAKFPQGMIGYSLAATALCELQRFADADDLLRMGLSQNPNDEELLEKYAWIAQRRENRREAKRRWRKLRAAYPENRAASLHEQESAS